MTEGQTSLPNSEQKSTTSDVREAAKSVRCELLYYTINL